MIKIFFILIYFSASLLLSAESIPKYIIDTINYTAQRPENLKKGDKERGKEIFASRKVNCLSCHKAPIKEEKFQGNFGPNLEGVGDRYSKEQLRLIIINPKIFNPDTIMPAYFKNIDYFRTPDNLKNKTILNINEVEDIVEYLYSLKSYEKKVDK